MELDGPLTVGTQSRQGLLRLTQMRQVVDVYEPGRRIEFRFMPGLGIVGTHRLEVVPLGADRARLTHTLDCRVEAKMLALYPILIRVHDALVGRERGLWAGGRIRSLRAAQCSTVL